MLARQILIVDKDNTVKNKLRKFFNDSNYDVECTSSAAYAIAKIVQGNKPVIILGDNYEEVIKPTDVIALMKHCDKNLNIILISDNSSLEALAKMRSEGIYYHSLRPQNAEDIAEIVSVIHFALLKS